MSWVECIANPQAIWSLFERTADLEVLDVHEVTVHRDGPTMSLRADLSRFPEHPPRRWPTDANRAQIRLSLYGVTQLRIDGMSTRNIGPLRMTLEPEHVMRFELQANELYMSGICISARVDSISGYIDSAD